MKKLYFMLFCTLGIIHNAQSAGDIYSVEQKLNVTTSGIFALMNNGDTSNVNADLVNFINTNSTGLVGYKITYYTPNYNGQLVKATGLVMYPQVNFNLSTILYCHPTTDNRNNVPSNLKDVGGFGFALPLSYALSGYIIVAPDYLGMGSGDGIHPYVNAKTQASASIDMMRAANTFLAQQNVKRYNENFITGYSQGGHAVMSVLKFNKEKYNNLYQFKYAYPGAGPYDLSQTTFVESILPKDTYPNSAFLAYVINSCNYIGYQQYQNSPSEIIAPAFQQTYQDKVINEQGGLFWGPNLWKTLFKTEYIQAVTNNTNHPLRNCLKESDVHQWYNRTPTTMGYALLDQTIAPKNSWKTRDIQRSYYPWWDLAKYNIESWDLGGFEHGTGAIPHLFASIAKFNSLRSGGYFNLWAMATTKGNGENNLFTVSKVKQEILLPPNTSYRIKKYGESTSKISENTALDQLEAGLYMIEVTDELGKQKILPFVKENPTEISPTEMILNQNEKEITINTAGLEDLMEINIFDNQKNRIATVTPSQQTSIVFNVENVVDGEYIIELAGKNKSLTTTFRKGTLNIKNDEVKIYSNNDQLIIESTKKIGSIEVYDVSGKVLLLEDNILQHHFESKPFIGKGVVLVKILYTDKTTQVKKIMK